MLFVFQLVDVENYLNHVTIEEKLKENNIANNSILLSLDGGGIRGLVLIRVIITY